MYNDKPMKPLALNAGEQARWDHTGLRRRMILGAWAEDLEDELSRHLPPDRREAWGPSDMSSNPFEQITRQLAVLYHENPAVTKRTGDQGWIVATDAAHTTNGDWIA